MKLLTKPGTTSKLVQIFIPDSSQTDGRGLTGLVYNSSNLSAYYYREGAANPTQITLADMTVGTWASGGFKEIDSTNMPGWYQVGLPDAVLAAGANSVGVQLKGATNMPPINLEIQLDFHAGVNAEVVDVLRTDTITEITSIPADNAPLHSMIQLIYAFIKNKLITTETTQTLRNGNDDSDIGSSTLVHAVGSFTRGKYS
jgi:hypothetical protein